ncbi:unnamed protein product [Mytilus coruscus]|uniref:Uncharacterized protein n=1 Tax=Mytilus coruscus TaxID=42192 RepID=A0A6J8BI01_MYTCO|nr:unnamed protein product [Mytilus coruscus]
MPEPVDITEHPPPGYNKRSTTANIGAKLSTSTFIVRHPSTSFTTNDFNNINDTNQRIQRLEMTLNERLAKTKLGIADANTVSFQNVHRLGERQDGKHRSIIARFTSYNDHKRVRKAAADKLKNKNEFSVYQQYPREIYERRKQLIPKLQEFQRQKKKVKLI